jgi:catechol 2,3-dioxygenase-like lactoylglutathione lyase family enzyme
MESKSQLLRHAPYFLVADVAQAAAYYQDVLGFRSEYCAGEPPQFAIHSRDGLAVMLRLAPDAAKIVPSAAQGGTWDAFFWVTDVRALLEELRSRGALIAYELVYQAAYRMDEFAVRDLDGYVLGFGQEWHPV